MTMTDPPSGPWLSTFKRSPVLALAPHRRVRRTDVVNLANNELHHPVLASLIEEATEAFRTGQLSGYPSWPPFIEQLAHALSVSPESLLLVAGSDDAYRLLLEALPREAPARGVTVVAQHPTYASLSHFAVLRRLPVVQVPYRPWHGFDVADLVREQGLRPGAAIVWISQPNGPTGSAFSTAELTLLAEETARSGNLLVVDEVYRDFADEDTTGALDGLEHVVRIRSFSKGYGLAGARLGYLLAHPELIGYLARWNTASPVSGPALHTAAHLLRTRRRVAEVHAEIRANRAWFTGAVGAVPGLTALPSQGNFVCVHTGDDATADRVLAALDRELIAVRDLRPLGVLGPVVRVSMATRDVLDEVVRTLRDAR